MSELRNEYGQPVGAPMTGWSPRSFPPHTDMVGQYCRLVPLRPDEHAKDLFGAFTESEKGMANWTYLPYGPFASYTEFASWLRTDCQKDDPQFYTIIGLKTGLPAGVASYLRIQPHVGSIEVGHIHYSASLQKTAVATETMYLMMKRAFDELGYRRYEWKCDSLNEPSRNAALRLGFTFEGIFRQATIYKGRSRDTAWYSIIDTEWPSIRHAFESWLSANNFDDQGNQRKSLASFLEQARGSSAKEIG